MELRFIERDGIKVLQEWTSNSSGGAGYTDVPTVQEPRKPREFFIEVGITGCQNELRAWPITESIIPNTITYSGRDKPDLRRTIKVREVIE